MQQAVEYGAFFNLRKVASSDLSVAAINVVRISAFGAGVDGVAAAGVSASIAVVTSKACCRIDFGISKGFTSHSLTTAVATLTVSFVFVPAVGFFFLS